MYAYVWVSVTCVWMAEETGEDIRFWGSGVPSGSESPKVGVGNHIAVPWKSSQHSTTEPFLQSLNFLMRPRFNKTLMIIILYSRPKNEQLHRFLGPWAQPRKGSTKAASMWTASICPWRTHTVRTRQPELWTSMRRGRSWAPTFQRLSSKNDPNKHVSGGTA